MKKSLSALLIMLSFGYLSAMNNNCPSDEVRSLIEGIVNLKYEFQFMAEFFEAYPVGSAYRPCVEFVISFQNYIIEQTHKAHHMMTHNRTRLQDDIQKEFFEQVVNRHKVLSAEFVRCNKTEQRGNNFLVSPQEMTTFVKSLVILYTQDIIKIVIEVILNKALNELNDYGFAVELCQELRTLGYGSFIPAKYQNFPPPIRFILIYDSTLHDKSPEKP